MAFQTTTQVVQQRQFKPADGWLNVYVKTKDGKDLKVGAIPLDNENPLHARINAACMKGGTEAIEASVTMLWQPGGKKEAGELALDF